MLAKKGFRTFLVSLRKCKPIKITSMIYGGDSHDLESLFDCSKSFQDWLEMGISSKFLAFTLLSLVLKGLKNASDSTNIIGENLHKGSNVFETSYLNGQVVHKIINFITKKKKYSKIPV